MSLSSILVYSSPGCMDEVNTSLSDLPGIEVHYQCRDTGRLVVIQDVADEGKEEAGLRAIKELPNVLAAEMVYHYQEPEFQDGTVNTGRSLS